MILLENDTSPNVFRNWKNECKTVEATVTGLVTVHCICSSQSACKSLRARSWPGPIIASQSHICLSSLYVVTGPSDWFNSTDTTESLLLTLSKILVADVLCTRDSARYQERCPCAEKCLLLEQSHKGQATLEVTGSTGNTTAGTTGVLWDCARGRETEDGLEGHSWRNRSPKLVRQTSSCPFKTLNPEFLNYWSLHFS